MLATSHSIAGASGRQTWLVADLPVRAIDIIWEHMADEVPERAGAAARYDRHISNRQLSAISLIIPCLDCLAEDDHRPISAYPSYI